MFSTEEHIRNAIIEEEKIEFINLFIKFEEIKRLVLMYYVWDIFQECKNFKS